MSPKKAAYLTAFVFVSTMPGPMATHGASARQPDEAARSFTPVAEAENPTAAHLLNQTNEALAAGAWDDALELAHRAVAAGEQGGPLLEAECLQALGNTLFHLERHREALPVFQRALEIAEGKGDISFEAQLLKDIGITEKLLGLYEPAMLHLEHATRRNPKWRDSEMAASVLGNLGSLYSRLGAHQLALNTFEEGLAASRRLGDMRGEIGILSRIGALYITAGHPHRALDFLDAALALPVEGISENDASMRGWLLDMAGTAHAEAGHIEHALSRCREAVTMWRAVDNRAQESLALEHLARLLIDQDLEKAEVLFEQSMKLAGDFLPLYTVNPMAGLAEVRIRQGRTDEAIDLLTSAMSHIENQRKGLVSSHQRIALTQVNLSVYHSLVEALIDRGRRVRSNSDIIAAFEVLERARARVLAEDLAAHALESGPRAPPDLAARHSDIRRRLHEHRLLLIKTEQPEESRRKLLANLQKTELEADAVIEAIRRTDPHFASLHYPQPVTATDAMAMLDSRTAIVSYLLTEDRVIAFVVTADEIEAYDLPTTPSALLSRVENCHDLLGRRPEEGWLAVGSRLYADLARPFRSVLDPGIDALIIIPDGILHLLPFEAIPVDSHRGNGEPRFLLDEYEISYAPSVSVLSELRRLETTRAQGGALDALVVADPNVPIENDPKAVSEMAERVRRLYEDNGFALPSLPHGADEAAVVSRYGGPGSVLRLGTLATESYVKSTDLKRFGVLHFATHGLVTPTAPWRSALVLAPGESDDGFLQAREIATMRVHARLVVLSACRTARGRTTPTEGVQSLTRAFIRAGATSVVSSLWDVDDEQTAQLIEAFYGRLAAGSSKAAALRTAKIDRIQRIGRKQPPAAWASFVLIGAGAGAVPLAGPAADHTGVSRWLIMASILVVALAFSGIVGRNISKR